MWRWRESRRYPGGTKQGRGRKMKYFNATEAEIHLEETMDGGAGSCGEIIVLYDSIWWNELKLLLWEISFLEFSRLNVVWEMLTG